MPGLLQHSPARIIGAYFATLNVASDPDSNPGAPWPVFDNRYADEPDNVVCVSDTRGRDFGYTQPDSERQEMNGIQVFVRSASTSIGWQKIVQLALVLDGLTNYHISLPLPDDGTVDTGTGTGTGTGPIDPGPGSARYQIASVLRTTECVCLGRDTPEGKRVCYTVNALVSVRECATSAPPAPV